MSTNQAQSTSNGGAVPGAGAPATKTRVALWEHARLALIALVVIGHLLTTMRGGNDLAFALYVYIYAFHMPAMILLSGVFSKPEVTPKAIRSTWQLIITWLLWEGIWAFINLGFTGNWLKKNWLVSPAWTLWFLVTLATMRILLPYIARLRHPLIFSIVLALAAGFAPAIGSHFSASRTLCFLPFFVLGWIMHEKGWFAKAAFLKPSRGLRAAAGTLLGGVLLALVLWPGLRGDWRIDAWLTWRDDYATLFESAAPFGWDPGSAVLLAGMGVRIALLALAVLLTGAVLIVVPRREGRFTAWGSRTLYVYLLHGPIIRLIRESEIIEWIGALGQWSPLLLIVLGLAITAALSSNLVARVFRPVIEPRTKLPFKT